MRSFRITAAAGLTACLALAPIAAQAAPASGAPGQAKPGHYSFAVIGDVPYGAAQVAAFPEWVDEINAADPRFTVHVGDIKNGSTRCDNAYYGAIATQFDRFENPLIYTPGDNEWTDCHRTNNGAYHPLERLAYDRQVFFAQPGETMGSKPMKVTSDAASGFPEIVRWRKAGVQFAALHVVGSNDDLAPWTGIGYTEPTAEQLAEQAARMESNLETLRAAFADATKRHDRAVAIFLQADMFDPTYDVGWENNSAFAPLVQALVDESNAFDGQVYLFDGDSHVYNVDKPLAAGSQWLTFYGVQGSADNLTRITVDGSANNTDWLKVTVNRPGAEQVLSWVQVPYQHQA